ncbi:interferon alpha-17-like [Protopterus annectens]|uniref:interferon alpha-17-like n=1 Tax=Protopterus annectens TaxID=7888 RepID=UPI001CF952F2|nr:interferon alpha-17-like [Protopterus annectens]
MVWRSLGKVMLYIYVCNAVSLGCISSSEYQRQNQELLKFLHEMGGSFPVSCRGELIPSVRKVQNHLKKLQNHLQKVKVEDAVSVTLAMFQEVQKLFTRNFSAAKWNKIKADNFLELLYQQSNVLHHCLVEKKMQSKNNKAVKVTNKYFKKLLKILKQKGYDRCSWEFVRDQVRTILQYSEPITVQ